VNIQYEDKGVQQKKNYNKSNPNTNQKPNTENRDFKPKGKNFKKFPQKNFEGGNFSSNKVTGSNKFDNMQSGSSPYYPNNYLQQNNFSPEMFPQEMMNMQQYFTNPSSTSTSEMTSGMEKVNLDSNVDPEQKVMDTLDYYFSIENLNKDYFFRKKLDENGYIDAEIIMTFNTMKKYSVTKEKIRDILKKFDGTVEANSKDEILLLRNKNWENIKSKLSPLETVKELHLSKKANVQNNNVVTMQNNYYIYSQMGMGQYQYPQMMGGYMNPMTNMNMNYQMYNPNMNNNQSDRNY